jgi:hypothetical protein
VTKWFVDTAKSQIGNVIGTMTMAMRVVFPYNSDQIGKNLLLFYLG